MYLHIFNSKKCFWRKQLFFFTFIWLFVNFCTKIIKWIKNMTLATNFFFQNKANKNELRQNCLFFLLEDYLSTTRATIYKPHIFVVNILPIFPVDPQNRKIRISPYLSQLVCINKSSISSYRTTNCKHRPKRAVKYRNKWFRQFEIVLKNNSDVRLIKWYSINTVTTGICWTENSVE